MTADDRERFVPRIVVSPLLMDKACFIDWRQSRYYLARSFANNFFLFPLPIFNNNLVSQKFPLISVSNNNKENHRKFRDLPFSDLTS
jgi:hypothetical protein